MCMSCKTWTFGSESIPQYIILPSNSVYTEALKFYYVPQCFMAVLRCCQELKAMIIVITFELYTHVRQMSSEYRFS